MYLKSETNQSYPHLLIDIDRNRDLGLQIPLQSVHALSLNNISSDNDRLQLITTDNYRYSLASSCLHLHPVQNNNKKFLPKSCIEYKKLRSSAEMLSKGFQERVTSSNCFHNFDQTEDIGWNTGYLPPFQVDNRNNNSIFPHLAVSNNTINFIQAKKNFTMSLKAIKASIPVQSKSFSAIPQEQFNTYGENKFTFHLNAPTETPRNVFSKSRSFNSFDKHTEWNSKSAQRNEDDFITVKVPSINRNLLSLDIVKSFNDYELKPAIRRKIPEIYKGKVLNINNKNISNEKMSHRVPISNKNNKKTLTAGNNKSKLLPCSKPDFKSGLNEKRNVITNDPIACTDSKLKTKRLRKLGERHNVDQTDPNTNKTKTKFKNVFKNFNSFSSDDNFTEADSNEIGSDDVFETISGAKQPNSRNNQRRSSSLEDLNSIHANKINEKLKPGHSVVSINEKPKHPQNCTNNKLSFNNSYACNSSSYPSIANRALNFPNNPIGVAPQLSPQKPSTSSSLTQQKLPTKYPINSSEYDVRDRSRGQGNGGSGNRDSYRDRNELREPSRSLSDRDQRDPGSFNRSLSNAEGTPEDKIGKLCKKPKQKEEK